MSIVSFTAIRGRARLRRRDPSYELKEILSVEDKNGLGSDIRWEMRTWSIREGGFL